MPDAREEVLRAFTRQGEVATAHGNCVPADELVFRKVQHIDARAMADEILSLRAARDAAQREREEREETIRELGDVLQHICELYSPSADHSQYMRSHAQAAITKGGAYLNRRAELNEERMNRIAAEFQRDAALAEVERLKAAPTCVEVVAGGGSLLRYKLSGDTLTVWVGNGMSLAPDDAQGARIEALCTTWAMKWDRERAALPAAEGEG